MTVFGGTLTRSVLCVLLCFAGSSLGVPKGFPASGNGLWYKQPGKVWVNDYLPVGNGKLAAMVSGGTTREVTQLNIESLWVGGPFADPSYDGGNKQPSERADMVENMQKIRRQIFQSPTGNIDNVAVLTTDAGQYGSYAGAGHLISSLDLSGPVSDYARWLDMDQGVARTSWTQNNISMLRTTFCSHPAGMCVQHLKDDSESSLVGGLPEVSVAFSSALEAGLPVPDITCGSESEATLVVSGRASVSPPSMAYALVVRAATGGGLGGEGVRCVEVEGEGGKRNATLVVRKGEREVMIMWDGETGYDMDAGDEAHGYSFKGDVDPVSKLEMSGVVGSTRRGYEDVLREHVEDVKRVLWDSFSLDLGQGKGVDVPTDELKAGYRIDGDGGAGRNVYVEWVLFNYGRYLLAMSGRGRLPANLQGKWANGVYNAWSGDYHANINLQMNYWAAEMTGLGALTRPMFDYMEKTWAPRGSETAKVLYNISRGWVTHNEMNIFGHTGMKAWDENNSAEFADYPEANAWMMFHVWDHFDYTRDVKWWRAQGWPLLKAVASFHLDRLVTDEHFDDSTLVVCPCNSPEQKPITFGCAHSQQVIWQLFNAVEKGFEDSGDEDVGFLEEVRRKRAKMDKGIGIGSWGQLKEWKVDQDSPTDRHRHLSHLIGLYPGYAITGYDPKVQSQPHGPGYTRDEIRSAAVVSLEHRGNGTGSDADSGWEKVWRAAAWAQLGEGETFYHILSFAISENFGDNLFSIYAPGSDVFQIDANLGYPAGVLNALVQVPDVASYSQVLSVRLLPAMPRAWARLAGGSVRGVRLRGGVGVDVEWERGRLVRAVFRVGSGGEVKEREVRVVYEGRELASFRTRRGMVQHVKVY